MNSFSKTRYYVTILCSQLVIYVCISTSLSTDMYMLVSMYMYYSTYTSNLHVMITSLSLQDCLLKNF